MIRAVNTARAQLNDNRQTNLRNEFAPGTESCALLNFCVFNFILPFRWQFSKSLVVTHMTDLDARFCEMKVETLFVFANSRKCQEIETF
jgi:hypothetical protein